MDRIEKLKEFLVADPHDAFVKHALALEYTKLGEHAEARRLWEEVLEGIHRMSAPIIIWESYWRSWVKRRWPSVGMRKDAGGTPGGRNEAYNELQAANEDLTD